MGKSHSLRKAEIIHTVLDLAAETGVSKISTQAIADRVGIAQATVFRHFKTRDAIFTDTIEWLSQLLFEHISPCFNASSLSADQRLNCLVEQQLKFIAQHKGLPRLLFSDHLHIESPTLRLTTQSLMSGYIQRVATLIREGQASTCFNAAIDPDHTAAMVASLMQGTVMRWSIFDFKFELEDEIKPIQGFIQSALAL